MTKVFIPETKGRAKTDIRGFWYSNDTKRTYYDYLRIEEHNQMPSYKYIYNLMNKYNQEAIAIIDSNNVLKIYSKDKIEVLSNRIYQEVDRQNLKKEIKEALNFFNGITIYKKDKTYFKEIFFKNN
jgi:hypothetical protein